MGGSSTAEPRCLWLCTWCCTWGFCSAVHSSVLLRKMGNNGTCSAPVSHLSGACLTPVPYSHPFSLQASQLGVYRAFVDNYGVAMETAEKCCQANAQFAEISEVCRIPLSKVHLPPCSCRQAVG